MKVQAITGIRFQKSIMDADYHLRVIDVPDEELTGDLDNDLERIFYYGQNDFQPCLAPSLSAGDIVLYRDKIYACQSFGWAELPQNLGIRLTSA